MKRRNPVMSLSRDFNLFINMSSKGKSNKKLSTFKAKKPLERQVADKLVKLSERNDQLKEKTINRDIFDLF